MSYSVGMVHLVVPAKMLLAPRPFHDDRDKAMTTSTMTQRQAPA
jgi:hypothetical protein